MARRSRRELDDYEEDLPDLPSTTRAVAWTALLFATLALVVALATLFLTWRDGVLAQNAVLLSAELSRHWRRGAAAELTTATAAATAPANPLRPALQRSGPPAPALATAPAPAAEGPIATNPTELARLGEIRQRLEELEGKLLRGDKNAPLNLEQLRRELEGLRGFASDATNRWVNPALARLREARALVQQNGPQAAAVMRTLANDLAQRLERKAPAPAAVAPPAAPEALPQPEPEAPDSAPLERDAYRPWQPDAPRATPADRGTPADRRAPAAE